MTNISKQNITSKDYMLMHNELLKLVAKSNKKTAPFLIDELLTKTERIMVVKRFGAIFMFTQLYSPYRVSQTLGMSAPTAYRLHEQYEKGRFSKLLSCLNRKETFNFLKFLKDLIVD